MEIGGTSVSPPTGLRDSAMLTQDENIVDIRFSVQYRLKDARAFLFENQQPGRRRGAGRRVGGARDRRHAAASTRCCTSSATRSTAALVKSIQAQLDTLNAGILIANVNVESVKPPEQVQAAFDDVVKAGQDRDALKNEGQAYANDVIPTAQGDAARLREDALGYKARIVDAAEGDAERFKAIYAEYQKAPAVTRDRMYIDAMQEVYSQRHQGDGRHPRRHQPAPAAARQAAAGRRADARRRARRRAAPADAGAAATVTVTPPTPQRRCPLARQLAQPRSRQPLRSRSHEQNLPRDRRRHRSPCCVASSSLFVVDQRQVAVIKTFGEIKEVITEPGLNFNCRRWSRTCRCSTSASRRWTAPTPQPDLHRREEEPGDRLAGEVAHHRPAPVHPQQRRRACATSRTA